MTYRIFSKSLFVLVTCFIFSSCGALVKMKAKKYATVEQGAIPENFGEDAMTMLFITRSKRSYDKYLRRNIKKAYRGDYKLVAFNELLNEAYEDSEKYPYYFDFQYKNSSYRNRQNSIYGPAGSARTRNVRVFGITDRRTKKNYTLKMTSGFWSKVQRSYIKNMEVERMKKFE